ncbi:hypothetical protein [[Phormidium] sp. LEGE 05292]|uniref:hypothetical protein n=1 Tax=[Phormidium] sp. LEGE 05292 TaxID=767427 RepID=UPI001D141B41|nr:hypothetical protein [Phormidium sp. LEGE 05292]
MVYFQKEQEASNRKYRKAWREFQASCRRAQANRRRTQARAEADQRRRVREVERYRRELAKREKELAKMQELERAKYEVEVYENQIDCLLSIHKECGEVWDWKMIQSSPPPTKPERLHENQKEAQANLDGFKPSLCDKLFRRVESKRNSLIKAVEQAKETDERQYQDELQEYTEEYQDWEITIEIAEKIIRGVSQAYIEAIEQTEPFEDISDLGSSFEFKVPNKSTIEATIEVNSEQVIPSEVKSLLKSGKLSQKKMPKGQFYEIYQDYICGCVLRVARELFALLPIQLVIVTAVGEFLNSQTGNLEEKTVLSVAIPRDTFEKLNFENLDPSDSMSNFVHRMKFKKTQGFIAVEKIKLSDLN